MIVLNNCTTMGPKYVDRKVMKASRAMPELSVATGIGTSGGGGGRRRRRRNIDGARGWLIGSANKG